VKWWMIWLFSSCSLWGMYSGNPLAPRLPADGIKAAREQPIQLRGGYLGDFLFHTSISDNGECSGNFQTLNVGGVIQRRVNIELMGGSSSMHLVFSKRQQTKIYASGGVAYGARAQAIVKKWGEVVMGLSAGGLLASPHVHSQTIQGNPTAELSRVIRLKTWQLGVAFARENALLSPYIGCKMGDLLGKVGRQKFGQQRRGGIFIGCGITPYAILSVNLEAHFIDEQSGSIEAYIGF